MVAIRVPEVNVVSRSPRQGLVLVNSAQEAAQLSSALAEYDCAFGWQWVDSFEEMTLALIDQTWDLLITIDSCLPEQIDHLTSLLKQQGITLPILVLPSQQLAAPEVMTLICSTLNVPPPIQMQAANLTALIRPLA